MLVDGKDYMLYVKFILVAFKIQILNFCILIWLAKRENWVSHLLDTPLIPVQVATRSDRCSYKLEQLENTCNLHFSTDL